MVATLVIFLREGIEASMVVAILLAALDRMGQRRHYRDVFAGVAAAMLLVLAGGVAAYLTIKTYAGSRAQTIFETVTYLVAAVVLTYMTLWMRSHAPTLSRELREKAAAALDGRARWGLGLLAFQAVGREGLETMVFTLAIVFASTVHGALIGAGIGLAASLVIAYGMYHLGKRLNLAVFFRVVGVLLIFFGAGILVDAVENLQQLGWFPWLAEPLWHTGRILSEDSALGDIFHSFFGYAQSPTVAQGIVYPLYLLFAFAAFFRRGRSSGAARKSAGAASSAGPVGAGPVGPVGGAPATTTSAFASGGLPLSQ
ncbi:MAG TPA: FTR1 family protein [Acidimicrobiales bacterium]|nr:FTR1 family protein [Acidimicrobiales bacterium]